MRSSARLKSRSISCPPVSPSGSHFAKRGKKVTIGVIFALTTLLARLLSPQAIAPLKPKSIEELSRLADVIIEGRVASQREESGMTIITLEIEKTLKGEAKLRCQRNISIKVRGSEQVPVEHQVTFQNNQRVLLFLVETSEPGYYTPYFGGKFDIEDNRIADLGSLTEVERRVAQAVRQKPKCQHNFIPFDHQPN